MSQKKNYIFIEQDAHNFEQLLFKSVENTIIDLKNGIEALTPLDLLKGKHIGIIFLKFNFSVIRSNKILAVLFTKVKFL